MDTTRRVTPAENPDLDWGGNSPGTWLLKELLQSDAFRSLPTMQKDILLFALTRRYYPKKKKRNYWEPSNRDHFLCPVIAIQDFFDGRVKGMREPPPSPETIRRAFDKFMERGFLSLKHLGGNGPGDQNIYRLENNWRLWKTGDPPCFVKKGMSKAKGFCQPGSGVFYNGQ
ncbi:MAG: hypothetical protein GY702_10620 [Desulfobulbaceae bacterium]|nr:hypothetical protein [Desulfobulbaceae bacterium]